jgi:hypothetical protein
MKKEEEEEEEEEERNPRTCLPIRCSEKLLQADWCRLIG